MCKKILNRLWAERLSWRFRIRFDIYTGKIRVDGETIDKSRVGLNTNIRGSLSGRNSSISLGDGVTLARSGEIGVEEGEVSMDAGVFVGPRTIISTTGGRIGIGQNSSFFSDCIISGVVSIGAGCLFARNVSILSSTHEIHGSGTIRENDAAARLAGKVLYAPVIVGDDCWLGSNVVVLPGVTLGDGTVVGANAVVTKSFPAYSIVAGVPAKLVGSRLRESGAKAQAE